MADMNGLRMTLVSDPTPEFPNNTNTTFQVRLSDPLQLKGDGWEAALVSMSTPNKTINAATFGLQDTDTIFEVQYGVVSESNPAILTPATRNITAQQIFNVPSGVKDGMHFMQLVQTQLYTNMRQLGQLAYDRDSVETRMYWI